MSKATNKPKVLYVEDDVDDRMFLSESFAETQHHAELTYAHDGEEAIQLLNSIREPNNYPSLIILDLNMPRKNGCQTLSYLKSSPTLATIPVVIFSTSDNKSDIDICWKLGAASYIPKPFSYKDYKQVVEKFISLMHIAD